mgnify:CR=1 FL=1
MISKNERETWRMTEGPQIAMDIEEANSNVNETPAEEKDSF